MGVHWQNWVSNSRCFNLANNILSFSNRFLDRLPFFNVSLCSKKLSPWCWGEGCWGYRIGSNRTHSNFKHLSQKSVWNQPCFFLTLPIYFRVRIVRRDNRFISTKNQTFFVKKKLGWQDRNMLAFQLQGKLPFSSSCSVKPPSSSSPETWNLSKN